MASYARLAKRLQSAINQRAGAKLLINTSQWYSKDKGRAVTSYVIRQEIPENKSRGTVEMFRTYSQVQMVLWLRDYWYEMNGWEIPKDNEEWEEVKAQYYGRQTGQT